MKNTSILFAATTLLLGSLQAHAISIGFNPSAQDVDLGDSLSVDLVVSGLGAGVAPSISVFDLDVSFDQTLLSYSGAVFGDPALGDQLDLFGFGSDTLATDLGGIINLYELSFDFPDDLNDFQADAFTMVTVTFNTLAAGTSNLALSLNALGDSNGDSLAATLETGSIAVKAQGGVPEPFTGSLFALGLLGLGFFGPRRRKFTSRILCGAVPSPDNS